MPHRGRGRRPTVLVAGVDPGQLPATRLCAARRSRRGQDGGRSPPARVARRRQDRRRGVVRARRGPHAHPHDHGLRPRPIRARRLSRSAARLLQRPLRIRARPQGARPSRSRSRSSRRRTRIAKTGASRRRSCRASSTSAASARIEPPTTTSCSIIPSRSATSRASSSRRPACRIASSLPGGSSPISIEIAADLAQICTTQIEFFGRPAPFDRYWFLGLAVGEGYGGLEHRASTSLIFGRDDLPKAGEAGPSRDYQRFLALASHEYFHAWHVKRTKPAAFMPYRLDRRNHTRLLWVFEGITSYYQELMLLRSGVVGIERVPAAHGRALDARLQNAGPVQAEPSGRRASMRGTCCIGPSRITRTRR